ncbi:MAG TPA: hypothetical protein VF950_03410 [Planctomycetota bacterium]
MLTKIRTEVTAQGDARLRRAWYHNPRADVLLVHDARTGAFLSAEIEWEGRGGQRAYVTWARAVGVRTGRVDTGETDGLSHKAAAVVVWDFQPRADFIRAARRLVLDAGIEEGLRDALLARVLPV